MTKDENKVSYLIQQLNPPFFYSRKHSNGIKGMLDNNVLLNKTRFQMQSLYFSALPTYLQFNILSSYKLMRILKSLPRLIAIVENLYQTLNSGK